MKNSLGRDALNLSCSKILTVTISLVTSMLLSRFLSLTEYGTYSQALMIANLAVSVFALGMPESVNYFLARMDNAPARRDYLSTYYTVISISSLLMGVVLAAVSPAVAAYFKNPMIIGIVYFMAVYPWSAMLSNSLDNMLVVTHKTKILMVYRVAFSLSLLAVLVISNWFHLPFAWYMGLFTGVDVIFAVIAYLLPYRTVGSYRLHIERRLLGEILRFSVPMGLAGIISRINIELDKLMIGSFFDTDKLAIYTNAAQEMPITVISGVFTAVTMPPAVRLIARKRNTDAVRLWGEGGLLCYVLFAFCAAALIVFAPEAMTLLYSDKYLPGVSVFRIYCFVLVLRSIYFGMALSCAGKSKFILISSIASLGLNVILNFICYLLFGFIGPAIATFVCIVITNILQLAFSTHCVQVSFRRIMPWKNLGAVTLVNLVMGASAFLVYWLCKIPAGMVLAVWIVIYIAVMFKFFKNHWKEMNRLGAEGAESEEALPDN